ncbi:chromatin-remodeling ATPase INO80-like [Daphnia carinata]|uniref:chromatin-remodeling ATPase INO80-like n=1 Tax=Daphnia carinata TaxID=120202 RepID=UPI0025796AC7|nr:chromatin-remodeling ATPase INO80-like [Daphnia carinata]
MAATNLEQHLAKPVHIQRLERSLRLEPFLDQVQEALRRDDDDSSDSFHDPAVKMTEDVKFLHGLPVSKSDRLTSKLRLYNFEQVGNERAWLKDVLLSDSSSNESESEDHVEEGIHELLYLHRLRKKYQAKFYSSTKNRQFMYYSAGLLSKRDIYPEHKSSILKSEELKSEIDKKDKLIPKETKLIRRRKKKTIDEEKESEMKILNVKIEPGIPGPSNLETKDTLDVPLKSVIATVKKEPIDFPETADFSFESDVEESGGLFRNVMETGSGLQSPSPVPSLSPTPFSPSPQPSPKGKKKKDRIKKEKVEKKGKSKKEKGPPSVKALIAQRRKLWLLICKKEISKASKARMNNHKEELVSCKRAATGCMRVCRLRAMQSQKAMKEIVWRAKRLTREMQSYWKRYDRVEKVQRRQAEKEAEEQRKLDVELMEARRQQRKLNFLITQTELYAHFMAKKLGNPDAAAQHDLILGHLDEEVNSQLAYLDDYDAEATKQRVMNNVTTAFHVHQQQTQQFDDEDVPEGLPHNEPQPRPEHAQPKIFQGSLKTYQLKGMNWIANLYDEGINGILADEMGLGKTVQSIAFLAHIAEQYGIWGPFLIISPASTLHNWQQELARFVPNFKVIPYWGSPQERKILRKFWDTRNLHTPEASFHVVVTSYQLIVTDYKYFNRIKWQYMVLDEAQAIKSASSARWKMLLGFNCRNRLLLSGTPIQNSMAELWALLHFIMPTLFDSHEEFNEWFSKDIESHAENKTGIDEKHLSRLHMILKPFMLRRVKKDVENELSDKIEIMMYCPLTNRQRMLYQALKRKISIDDLLYTGGSSATAQNATTTLMNLVMQFRKVCNHPELFERREAKSPYFFQPAAYILPKHLFREGLLRTTVPSNRHLLLGRFFIWTPEYTHHSLFPPGSVMDSVTINSFVSFSRLIGHSPFDLFSLMNNGVLSSLKYDYDVLAIEENLHHNHIWKDEGKPHLFVQPLFALSSPSVKSSSILSSFVFTSAVGTGYAHLDHVLHSMPETMEHRILRSRKAKNIGAAEFSFTARPTRTLKCLWTDMPQVLSLPVLKVNCRGSPVTCSDRSAAYWLEELSHPRNCEGISLILQGAATVSKPTPSIFQTSYSGGLELAKPRHGWSSVILPDKETLICDAGKLQVLDSLLRRLKNEGHRVLIYSQMTRIIDLLEEYMWHRKWTYMRLDGSSKISDRRDMVADFQTRSDIFVFLLSTRAGGLGINLTAADTVIFYDSDWNPTVDQQAMDRAHRLGQTKQVTVYRLICKGTIEERILQRAREKSKIQKIVISGGNFKPDTLKPTEVVSLLLDDEEIERKYRQRQAERKQQEVEREAERKRKYTGGAASTVPDAKRTCLGSATPTEYTPAASPTLTEHSSQSGFRFDETSNDGSLIVDDSGLVDPAGVGRFTPLIPGRQRSRPNRGTGRRGRPPGSGKRSLIMASSSGANRESVKANLANEIGFLSPEATNRLSDISSNNGEEMPTGQQDISAGPAVRRRPGRPRLRPVGPAHQGSRKSKTEEGMPGKKTRRGAPSGPRVIKPLPVPIGLMANKNSDGARTSLPPGTTSTPVSKARSSGCFNDSASP